ncbi:MAG TPA: trigger factor [Gemmatimonadales bacterium]|nr:trigger factor [Gemmatimonadales bacterium]
MAAISITKKAEEPGAALLAVTVPPENVREAEDRAARAYQSRAKLPGFRRGKAPEALVRKHFAQDIREQALQELLRESWKTALAQERLQPVADPHIHNLRWDEGSAVTFEFHVEVKPALRLERLGGFKLKRTVAPVTDAQVEAQLNELREQRAPWVPVEGEPPRPRDLVHVTIAPRAEGGGEAREAQPYQFVLGEGRAIPDVEERIMGLRPGETVEAVVRFPDDFPDEAKRGQTRDIRITLHEVKRQQLAELDDDFAREVGDFESLAALRRAIREDLERDAEREADARVRAELIEQIVAANNVVAPRPLVERALAVFVQAYGIPDERAAQFAAEFRPIAEAQVRRDLVLDHVAEAHGLRASDEELDRRLAELARRRGVPAAQLRASLEKANRLRDLRRSLTEEKVFAFLLSQSTVESS